LRLLDTRIYSNVGIDLEPSPVSNEYNPTILTTQKTNDLANIGFGVLKGAPLKTSYFDWWNAANSGISLNSSYRWDYNRKRGQLQLHVPIPLPGILFLDASGLWRSERWDVSRVLRSDAGAADRFQYNATGGRLELHYIPHYRFELGTGFEYTNRIASGNLNGLAIDSRNSAKLLFQGSIRLADNRYQNRIHGEAAVARQRIFGDLNFSKATVELNNQFLISKESNTVFAWTIKGGLSRGELPIEEYFTLGVDTQSGNLLRAHPASAHGHYGNSPMGTSFALSNMDIERRIAILPLFNTLNMPFLDVKVQAFVDSGKTFDRARLFKQGQLYLDTGAGLKFETPTHSLNLIYGRSLRDDGGKRNVLFAYIEKRW
jgi:outer membrane protein assembly factor BamA